MKLILQNLVSRTTAIIFDSGEREKRSQKKNGEIDSTVVD